MAISATHIPLPSIHPSIHVHCQKQRIILQITEDLSLVRKHNS